VRAWRGEGAGRGWREPARSTAGRAAGWPAETAAVVVAAAAAAWPAWR